MTTPALFTLVNGKTLMLDATTIVAIVDETQTVLGEFSNHFVPRSIVYTSFRESFVVKESLESVMHNIPRKKINEPAS